MAKLNLPPQEYLCNILNYNPDTGKLYWKYRADRNKTWNTSFASKEAFTARDGRKHGFYFVGTIDKKRYYKHRIIWKMVHGEDPDQIDHIDGDKQNNILSNLRNVQGFINQRNMITGKINAFGIVGVGFDKSRERYVARISTGKYGFSKRFDTLKEAIAQRKKWEVDLFYGPSHRGINV